MNTPDKLIIPNYSPISAKGGSKAIRKRKRTRRNKKSIKSMFLSFLSRLFQCTSTKFD